MDSNYHAIKMDFMKLRTKKLQIYGQINFLLFLKDIIELDLKHDLNLLELKHQQVVDYFKNTTFENVDENYLDDNLEHIIQCLHLIVKTNKLFVSLIKLCNSTSNQYPKNKLIKCTINDDTKFKILCQYVKNHALVNKIRNSLYRKSKEDITNYGLVLKLSGLNSDGQILKLLCIQQLPNIENSDLDEFIKKYRCSVLSLEVFDENLYEQIYDVFDLFK